MTALTATPGETRTGEYRPDESAQITETSTAEAWSLTPTREFTEADADAAIATALIGRTADGLAWADDDDVTTGQDRQEVEF